MLRYYNLWLSIGWLLVLMVCYLSLISNPPGIDIEFKYIDKLGHFLSYFILMAWFAQLYKTSRSRILYVLLFITMGAALEVLQGMGGSRFFEYGDMLANTTGVFVAWFITKGRLKNALLYFEQLVVKSTS